MPQGEGTYGSQVGRPSKKRTSYVNDNNWWDKLTTGGSIITGKPKRYGARGSAKKTYQTSSSNTNKTGSGSSSRRTGYGDFLSKKHENRKMRDPESSGAQNINANRKYSILRTLNITSQARMDRLKQALTHPMEFGEGSYEDAKTYDDVIGEQWEKRHPIKRLNTKP